MPSRAEPDLTRATPQDLAWLETATRQLDVLDSKAACEASLIEFVRQAWHVIDSSDYQDCWAIDALCAHLQAVTEGRIRKLLVNFPPRCGKTTVTSICWPVWTWIQSEVSYLSGPHVAFLCGSYAVQPLFEGGLIYAPDRMWAETVISQCEVFPKGKHDDLVDTVTMAVAHMRTRGMAALPREKVAEVEEDLKNYRRPEALYPV